MKPSGTPVIERIDHVNLVVEDLGAMIAFYRDLLGLRLTKRATISGPWIDTVTGLEGVEADVAFLEAYGGSGLELICYRRPRASRSEKLSEPNTPGLRHIAFRVSDLPALVERLHGAGAALLSPVQEVPAGQVDFAGQRKWLAYLLDPEGNLLELCAFGGD